MFHKVPTVYIFLSEKKGKQHEAKKYFSRMVVSELVFGSVFAIVINLFADQLLSLLGADAIFLTDNSNSSIANE